MNPTPERTEKDDGGAQVSRLKAEIERLTQAGLHENDRLLRLNVCYDALRDSIFEQGREMAALKAQNEALRGFVEECANDELDRISPGLKSKARALLTTTPPAKA